MHTQHAEPRGALRQLLTPLVVFIFQGLPRYHVRLRVASYDSCRASRCTQATSESTLSPTHLMQQLLAFVHPLLKLEAILHFLVNTPYSSDGLMIYFRSGFGSNQNCEYLCIYIYIHIHIDIHILVRQGGNLHQKTLRSSQTRTNLARKLNVLFVAQRRGGKKKLQRVNLHIE